jgi:site-specific DNA recombinase
MILETPTQLRFAIYVRISRDRVGAGLGVDRQVEDCRALVDQLGGTAVLILTDNDISAYSGKPRPGYTELLEAMRSGQVDAVAVWHTDRLHRSMIELEEYALVSEERGVATYTARAGAIDLATPSGRLVARQLGAVARFEVEHASERMKAKKLQHAKAGKYGGGMRPYGYQKDGVTIEPFERDVLLEMAKRIINGESYRAIALDLNARGITTSRDGLWRALKIPNVVFRKRNFGIKEHLGVEYPAEWPAIYDSEIREKLYAAGAARSELRKYRGRGRTYLLKGFLRCGVCGNGLTVYSCQQRDGSYVPAVACRTRDDVHGVIGCGGVKRNLAPIDDLITTAVLFRLDSGGLAKLVAEAQESGTLRKHLAEHQTQQTRLREILDLYSTGQLNFDEYRAAKTTATARLEVLGRVIDRAAVNSPLEGISLATTLEKAWETHGLEWRRQLLNLVINKIDVLPRPKTPGYRTPKYGPWIFDLELISIDWKM